MHKTKYLSYILIITIILLLVLFYNKKETFINPNNFHHGILKNVPKGNLAQQPSISDTTSNTETFISANKSNTINAFTNIQIFDQGNSSTCVANALSSAMQVFLRKNNDFTIPSRSYIYSITKYFENNSYSCNNHGIYPLNAENMINMYKIPNETNYTFPSVSSLNNGDAGILCNNIPNNLLIKPNPKKLTFKEINRSIPDIRNAIDAGNPILLSMLLFSSNLQADTNKNKLGFIPTPNIHTDTFWGAHCLLIIGYDRIHSILKLRNSWGKNYGDKSGYYTISYDFITNNTIVYETGTPFTAGLWVIKNYA